MLASEIAWLTPGFYIPGENKGQKGDNQTYGKTDPVHPYTTINKITHELIK